MDIVSFALQNGIRKAARIFNKPIPIIDQWVDTRISIILKGIIEEETTEEQASLLKPSYWFVEYYRTEASTNPTDNAIQSQLAIIDETGKKLRIKENVLFTWLEDRDRQLDLMYIIAPKGKRKHYIGRHYIDIGLGS